MQLALHPEELKSVIQLYVEAEQLTSENCLEGYIRNNQNFLGLAAKY